MTYRRPLGGGPVRDAVDVDTLTIVLGPPADVTQARGRHRAVSVGALQLTAPLGQPLAHTLRQGTLETQGRGTSR